MILRIVIEVILGILLLTFASSFWACVKSPRFLGRVLADYDQLKAFFDFLGVDKICQESQVVEPILGSFPANIATWMKASFAALNKARNMTLFLSVVIILITLLLGIEYLLINTAIFCLAALYPMPASAKNNMFSDIHTIILNVYKWNSVEEEECKAFCNGEQPRILKNIYRLVSESSSVRS